MCRLCKGSSETAIQRRPRFVPFAVPEQLTLMTIRSSRLPFVSTALRSDGRFGLFGASKEEKSRTNVCIDIDCFLAQTVESTQRVKGAEM